MSTTTASSPQRPVVYLFGDPMSEVFTLTMTLRAGYGEPPQDATVVVGDEVRRFLGGSWRAIYPWGSDARYFGDDTEWIEVPPLRLPAPSAYWVEVAGQQWVMAHGLVVSDNAPTVNPEPPGWFALSPHQAAQMAEILPTEPGESYPGGRRFNPRYVPILEAGDRHTVVYLAEDSPSPACAVWQGGKVIALVMPMNASDTKSPTLGEILERSRAALDVPRG